jgi:hypothetical protein
MGKITTDPGTESVLRHVERMTAEQERFAAMYERDLEASGVFERAKELEQIFGRSKELDRLADLGRINVFAPPSIALVTPLSSIDAEPFTSAAKIAASALPPQSEVERVVREHRELEQIRREAMGPFGFGADAILRAGSDQLMRDWAPKPIDPPDLDLFFPEPPIAKTNTLLADMSAEVTTLRERTEEMSAEVKTLRERTDVIEAGQAAERKANRITTFLMVGLTAIGVIAAVAALYVASVALHASGALQR